MATNDNVIDHPIAWARTDLDGAQTIKSAEQYDWEDVIVCGFTKDSENLTVRTSHMTREKALWLVEHLKLHVLGRL